MKKNIFFLLALISLWGCNKSIDRCSINVLESSLLLYKLNAYNSSLVDKTGTSRMINVQKDSLIYINQTRGINWRQFWLADAGGAWRGGKCGFMYGSAFSPSGAVAGAVVGGLLTGAIASGVDYWIQKGCVEESSVLHKMICSNEIFDSEELHALYLNISKFDFEKYERDTLDLHLPQCGEQLHSVGIGHNVLLDALLKYEETPSIDSLKVLGMRLSNSAGQDDDLLIDDFSAQMVSSKIFKHDFSELVSDQIERSENQIIFDQAETLPDYVMNLFLEASLIYSNQENNLTDLVNYYCEMIEPSPELSEEDKISLYMGMVVAAYSAKYWDKCNY